MKAKIFIAKRHEITMGLCGTDEDPKTIGVFLTRQEADELVEVDERCWVADNNEDPMNLDRDNHIYDDCSDECRWEVEEAEISDGMAFTREEVEDICDALGGWLSVRRDPSTQVTRVENIFHKILDALEAYYMGMGTKQKKKGRKKKHGGKEK